MHENQITYNLATRFKSLQTPLDTISILIRGMLIAAMDSGDGLRLKLYT